MPSSAPATTSERARRRATQSRLRAIAHATNTGARYYIVYNLTAGRKYTVSQHNGAWTCHCEAAKARTRCKHLQRVLDREEARTRREALYDA